MALTIYHNPRCSKSRQTLKLIEAAGITPEIRDYNEEPLDADEVEYLFMNLGFESPQDMMRKGEAIYKDLDLKNVDNETALITALAAHPKLIERPIVDNGEVAILGRPPENVKKLL